MKILYITHRFYPECCTGTERIVLSLAKMMQTCGHKVKVFAYSFHESSFYDRHLGPIAVKEFVYEGVPVLAFRYQDIPQDFDFGFENPRLAEIAGHLIRREGPDLIHATHSLHVGELLKAAKQFRVPYLVTVTDFSMVCPKSALVRSNSSACSGPESGRACLEHCPELPAEAIQNHLASARELLTHAQTVTATSFPLAQVFEKEFGQLRITVVESSSVLSPFKSDFSKRLLPTIEQEAYMYERIYDRICATC